MCVWLGKKLTEGETQRALDEVHEALEGADDAVDRQLEEVPHGGDEALDHLQDRLHEVRDARCDAHVCFPEVFF